MKELCSMTWKKSLVFSLIFAQALILLFLIRNRVWKVDYFGNRFRDVWTSWKNDSEMLDRNAELYGVIDLKDQQFSWLNEPAKNTTRNNYTTAALNSSTVMPSTGKVSNKDPPTSLGSKIIKPAIDESKGGVFLLVLVTTMPKSLERRELIRNTWAKAVQTPLQQGTNENLPSYVVFMLGVSGDPKQDKAIDEEAAKHGDILRAPSKETYRNLLDKVWFAFKWALPYHPKYIVKGDDDIYVRIPRLASWLTDPTTPKRLYAGYVHYRAYILRDPKSMHYVSKSEYKGQFFPDYCAGPFYTFSGDLLDEFLEESKRVTKFRVEDAYLGLLAKKIGVKPFNIGGKLFIWNRSLSKSVRQWKDRGLSKVICLGDSLTIEAIKYIHERYRNIDHQGVN